MFGTLKHMEYVLLKGLTCAECGRYDQPAKGWRAFHGLADPEAEKEVFVFCPECARKEFLETEDGSFTRRPAPPA
jgi:hypothetical protein